MILYPMVPLTFEFKERGGKGDIIPRVILYPMVPLLLELE